MKKFLLFVLVASFCVACAPIANRSFNGTKVNQKNLNKLDAKEMTLAQNEVNSLNPLESYLLRTPGVQIVNEGGGAKAKIRGASSFHSDTEPLFIVNGTDVGTSYASAANLVAAMEIVSVRVLKGPDASLYGVRGGNGVVIVKAR